MPQRFIRKSPHKKLVRPASRLTTSMMFADVNASAEKENNKINEKSEMNNIEQLKAIVGDGVKIPKRKVKVEKKEKGLIERTDNSTILLTEDNKMMLND